MADGTFLTALGNDIYDGFGRIDESNSPSQTTVLLQKKREMQGLQRQINKKRDECEQRQLACVSREQLLQEKQAKIQDAIKRFDKFIQENDVKRTRAAKKERDERQERLAKEAEIAVLSEKLEALKVARRKQKKELQAGKVYERYLEVVVEASGDFGEIDDALMRYTTLQGTTDDLGEEAEVAQAQVEETKAKHMQQRKEIENALLTATSSIAKKQKELENLRNTRMLLEQRLAAKEETNNQRIGTIGEARRAIANIYLRCRKPNHPLLNPDTERKQVLDYIKFRCSDLGNVAALKSQAPEKKAGQPTARKGKATKTAKQASVTGQSLSPEPHPSSSGPSLESDPSLALASSPTAVASKETVAPSGSQLEAITEEDGQEGGGV